MSMEDLMVRKLPQRSARRAALTSAVVLSTITTVALARAPLAGAATAGCNVTYTVPTQWPGGFTTSITITNLGSPLNGWTLAFTFPAAGQAVGQNWSATWAQSGQHVTASSLSWNAALASGAGTNIGFNGVWTTSNPTPSPFTLNGV